MTDEAEIKAAVTLLRENGYGVLEPARLPRAIEFAAYRMYMSDWRDTDDGDGFTAPIDFDDIRDPGADPVCRDLWGAYLLSTRPRRRFSHGSGSSAPAARLTCPGITSAPSWTAGSCGTSSRNRPWLSVVEDREDYSWADGDCHCRRCRSRWARAWRAVRWRLRRRTQAEWPW